MARATDARCGPANAILQQLVGSRALGRQLPMARQHALSSSPTCVRRLLSSGHSCHSCDPREPRWPARLIGIILYCCCAAGPNPTSSHSDPPVAPLGDPPLLLWEIPGSPGDPLLLLERLFFEGLRPRREHPAQCCPPALLAPAVSQQWVGSRASGIILPACQHAPFSSRRASDDCCRRVTAVARPLPQRLRRWTNPSGVIAPQPPLLLLWATPPPSWNAYL